MKIIIVPDSFKGSLSASEVAKIIEEGIKSVLPDAQVVRLPVADGGEGTVQALIDATNGKIIKCSVTGPLGERISSFFGILGDSQTVIIEMAAASGLPLVPPEKRNPMITTTYGTGELIKAALDYHPKRIIVGIGGSATNDGGAGMAQALGAHLLDEKRQELQFGGAALQKLTKIDISQLDERIKSTEILVASDVSNPLCGPQGAARVYSPQKGATPEMVEILDAALAHFAQIIKRDLNKDIKDIPGAGAAGGLGAGLMAFLNAKLRLGIDIVLETVNFHSYLKDADLIITGEGKIDSQAIFGKTIVGVAKEAKKYNLPVIALGGFIADDAHVLHEYGIDAMISIVNHPMTLQEAMSNADKLLLETTKQVMKLINLSQQMSRKSCRPLRRCGK